MIAHTSRADICCLENCRVLVKNGVPAFLAQDGSCINIPVANTTVMLLGANTSITSAAVRMLSAFGVPIGFCGSDCMSLFCGQEIDWFLPQNQYQPSEWSQKWFAIWNDGEKKLEAARKLQETRLDLIGQEWGKLNGFEDLRLDRIASKYGREFEESTDMDSLVPAERNLTEELYSMASRVCGIKDFERRHEGKDIVNVFLDKGNRLAYGMAACVLWILGIPQSLSVLHRQRGGLVYDVADTVKDALVLPTAFAEALKGTTEKDFIRICMGRLVEGNAMEHMFRTVETIAKES